MARSKRYNELKAKVEHKSYSPEEAIALAIETAKTKFDASIEVHVRLGIDPKKSDQQVRATVALPHGTGKTKKVAAFVSSAEQEKEAKEAGADVVGGVEMVDEIVKTGKIPFDIAIATPDMMVKMAKAAKILGPRGLMPSPKNETVTTNLSKTIAELKKGKIAFKCDDGGNVHQSIGKASFGKEKLLQNYTVFMEALRRAKPASSKGVFMGNITMSTTMGPGIKVAA